MIDFSYVRATSAEEARRAASAPSAMFLAGGTSLLDLAKCGVAAPESLIDISHLAGLDRIEVDDNGARIGALAKMNAVAAHSAFGKRFPAIVQSLAQAASPQIRNMASIGGNLMQRTRCAYFRDPATFSACNKRVPGSGCAAIGGVTRNHAILGASESCIATHPSDLATALVAFDTKIHFHGGGGIAAENFFLPPGESPDREHALPQGEMILSVGIPASEAAKNSVYLKVRDRASYEFAAASAAVGLDLASDRKTIRDIRVAIGGVATKPWRARAVEAALTGQGLEPDRVRRASALAVEGAVAHGENAHKITLVPRIVARAILMLGELA